MENADLAINAFTVLSAIEKKITKRWKEY
jgi:hypothetical protein